MTRLMRGWHTWRFLSQQQRVQWLQVWLLLPLVTLGLRLIGLRRMEIMLYRNMGIKPSREDLPASKTIVRIFLSATRWSFLPTSCLARSLVLCWLLSYEGLAADLRIGVRKLNGRFAAHAWVEHMGVALAEDEDINRHFTAFDRLPTPSQKWQI